MDLGPSWLTEPLANSAPWQRLPLSVSMRPVNFAPSTSEMCGHWILPCTDPDGLISTISLAKMLPVTSPAMITLFAWISALTFPPWTDPKVVILQFNLPFHTTFDGKIFFDVQLPFDEDRFLYICCRIGKCIQLSHPQVEQTRLPEVERDNVRVASQSAIQLFHLPTPS